MFSFEDFKALTRFTDRDELMHAIAQIPEEDLRPALTMTLLAWDKNLQINQEFFALCKLLVFRSRVCAVCCNDDCFFLLVHLF